MFMFCRAVHTLTYYIGKYFLMTSLYARQLLENNVTSRVLMHRAQPSRI